MLGNKEIELVSFFNYLGATSRANGSVHISMESLSCKEQRDANNRFPLKHLPVKAALTLFDSVVCPNILYGLKYGEH